MSASTDNGIQHRRQEVQQAVKNACDQLNADGVTPRDYVEQLAWLFFLKAFDEAENQREEEAEFGDEVYRRRLNGEYRWTSWASRTDRPDEMLRFVDGELWPHLCNFGSRDGTGEFDADPMGEQFRRIFSSVRNHSRRGASFARVVQQVDRLHFSDQTDVIVLSELYEDLLKRVAADSPGYAGEFYTQRHIIRAMVEVVRPRVGERIYDPCFGTGGFLAEAGEYVRRTAGTLSGADLERLKQESFFGIEFKPLTYLLGVMNLILHDIEGANLELGNTLERHSANVSAKHRYHVILSNPPYGGKLVRELQTNFTVRSGATEILFLQHIMANLATGGRAAVIIPEGVLFRGGPDAKVRERLLREFDVHTILSLPAGCFLPCGRCHQKGVLRGIVMQNCSPARYNTFSKGGCSLNFESPCLTEAEYRGRRNSITGAVAVGLAKFVHKVVGSKCSWDRGHPARDPRSKTSTECAFVAGSGRVRTRSK